MRPDGDARTQRSLSETSELRARVTKLEAAEAQWRATHAALRQSEAHFRQFYQDAPLACQSLDDAGRVLDVNAAWLEGLGYARDEVIGRWVGDFLTPTGRETFRQQFPRLKREGLIRGVECELAHKDGRTLTFAVDARVSRDAGGCFQQAHYILHDLTAQQHAAAVVAQRAQEMAALHAFTQQVCANLSLAEVTQAALDGLDAPVAPDLSLLFLRVGDELQLQAYHVLPGAAGHTQTPVHRVGECLCGRAARDGAPMYAVDVPTDPRCTWKECREAGLRSFAALPLRSGDEVLGVLGLASRTPRDFAARAQFLETLSRAIATGVQNALLYEQARAHAARLAALNAGLQQEMAARQRAEEELRASEVRFRTLVQSASTAVLYLTPDGRILEFNPEAERIYGRRRAAVLGRNYFDEVLPPDVRAEVRADLPRLLAGEPLRGYEKSLRAADGRERTLLWNVDCLVDDAGRPSGIIAIAQDITDRKCAEDLLREREARLQSIFRAAPIGISVSDDDRVFGTVNDHWCQMTGYAREELLGQSARLLYPSDAEFERVGRELRDQIVAHGMGTLESRWRRKDGVSIDVLLNAALVDPADPAKGRLHTALDITARRRAAEEKTRLEAQLRHSQKMEAIGQLAGGVAHDFNNILTAILGNAELAIAGVREGAPDATLLEELHQIDSSAQRAAGLTRQLLAFSRRQVSQPAVLNLNQTLKELQKMLRRLLSEDVELRVEAATDLHAVRVDAGQIEQVIVNLVVNARDAMPDGGYLGLATANVELDQSYVALHPDARVGPHVVLSVSDTGCGMDASMIERVFEPFFTTKGLGHGTGLGLATVYGIIRQTGGHITVYSEPGKGSTFRVYLPAVDAPPEPYTLEDQQNQTPGGQETILVCEDDATVRELTVHLLEDAGYTVVSAEDGARALELANARQTPVDLLITDVIMPELNGKKVSEALTALWPSLRTLYVSGYTSNVIAHHGVLDPGVQFLEKPFSRRALLQHVRQVLDD